MKIKVKLHSCFVFLSGDDNGVEELEYYDKMNISEIIEHYKIKSEYIAAITINKKIVDKDYIVKENDFIEILPIFGGG